MQMFKAFISYATKRDDAAVKLKELLVRKLGPDACWVDAEQIRVSENIDKRVREGIARSDVFLALASDAASSSRYCHLELAVAKRLGKPIAPLVLDATPTVDRWLRETVGEHVRRVSLPPGEVPWDECLHELVQLLDKPPHLSRAHSDLTAKAAAWDAAGRPTMSLLPRRDRRVARQVLTDVPDSTKRPQGAFDSPKASKLLAEYVAASRRHARNLLIGGITMVAVAGGISAWIWDASAKERTRHEIASLVASAEERDANVAADVTRLRMLGRAGELAREHGLEPEHQLVESRRKHLPSPSAYHLLGRVPEVDPASSTIAVTHDGSLVAVATSTEVTTYETEGHRVHPRWPDADVQPPDGENVLLRLETVGRGNPRAITWFGGARSGSAFVVEVLHEGLACPNDDASDAQIDGDERELLRVDARTGLGVSLGRSEALAWGIGSDCDGEEHGPDVYSPTSPDLTREEALDMPDEDVNALPQLTGESCGRRFPRVDLESRVEEGTQPIRRRLIERALVALERPVDPAFVDRALDRCSAGAFPTASGEAETDSAEYEFTERVCEAEIEPLAHRGWPTASLYTAEMRGDCGDATTTIWALREEEAILVAEHLWRPEDRPYFYVDEPGQSPFASGPPRTQPAWHDAASLTIVVGNRVYSLGSRDAAVFGFDAAAYRVVAPIENRDWFVLESLSGGIEIFGRAEDRVIASLRAPQGSIASALTRDGRRFFVLDADGELGYWDTEALLQRSST